MESLDFEVLQIICLIAGTCFARSKGDVWTYSLRLLMFCGLGTLLNWRLRCLEMASVDPRTALQAIHDPLRNDVICRMAQTSHATYILDDISSCRAS